MCVCARSPFFGVGVQFDKVYVSHLFIINPLVVTTYFLLVAMILSTGFRNCNRALNPKKGRRWEKSDHFDFYYQI